MKVLVSALVLWRVALAGSGPFAPFLNGTAPEIVRDFSGESRGNVSLHRVVFASRTVLTAGGPVRSDVFAVIARPTAPGRYPGILILHGGGGSAEVEKAVAWARRGYIAVAPDLPGIMNPEKAVNSSGPWKRLQYGAGRFVATPDATVSSIFDGVLAGVQALYLLRVQPGVMEKRVGVTGVSWGGYATIMVSSLAGNAVRAAFSIYGSGHFDLGSAFARELAKVPPKDVEAWMNQIDARNYASSIRASFFEVAATNDTYFWPPAVTATLADIRAPKNQLFAPNSDHWVNVPGGCEHNKGKPWHDNGWLAMQEIYFDYMLKGQGRPFPEVRNASAIRLRGGAQRIRFTVRSATKIAAAEVYYSPAGAPWKLRKWIKVNAARHGKWFEAAAPPNMDCLALVTDERPVTVTSGILKWRQ